MTLKANNGSLVVQFTPNGAILTIYSKAKSEALVFTYPKLFRSCKDIIQGAMRYAVDNPR